MDWGYNNEVATADSGAAAGELERLSLESGLREFEMSRGRQRKKRLEKTSKATSDVTGDCVANTRSRPISSDDEGFMQQTGSTLRIWVLAASIRRWLTSTSCWRRCLYLCLSLWESYIILVESGAGNKFKLNQFPVDTRSTYTTEISKWEIIDFKCLRIKIGLQVKDHGSDSAVFDPAKTAKMLKAGNSQPSCYFTHQKRDSPNCLDQSVNTSIMIDIKNTSHTRSTFQPF